ncbi:MAG: hypothetical protein Q4B31_01010 [Clostridia bacterium]|nr:hypothetical protein [Clostridia bacterium]
MWTVVYLANSTEAKDAMCKLLASNGIINRASRIESEDSESDICYNVLVPQAEVGAAHALILDEEL